MRSQRDSRDVGMLDAERTTVTRHEVPLGSTIRMPRETSRRGGRLAAAACVLAMGVVAPSPILVAAGPPGSTARANPASPSANAVLWAEPAQIGSRDLFYGPGGEQHQPPQSFTFLSEDLAGSTPKIVVRDDDGVKWKLKQGQEARPETVASRLVWAVGYSADENYFLPEVRVSNLPAHLHRGQKG